MSANKKVMIVISGITPGGLAASYQRAMESFGLRVTIFDLEAERARVAPLGKVGARVMQHVDMAGPSARANRVLVRAATVLDPALIVILGNEAVRPASLLQLRISLPSARIVNVFPDMLFNLRDSIFPALPLYDLFCCHTRAGLPFLAQAGCKRPFYLALAADPTLHKPEALTAADRRTYGCELVFVGNNRPEHAALFERLQGRDLAIWGSWQWKNAKDPWVRSRFRGREANGVDYAKAHIAAEIALNPIDPLDVPGHNMRVFELPACRVFTLVTRTEEVLDFFREGETVATFGSADELLEKVRHYLAHPEERRRIAAAAYERVVHGGHTYRDRVRALFTELDLGASLG